MVKNSKLPLEDVKILDLSQYAPGDLCTMMLGDFGAEVIKVEAPTKTGRRNAEESTATIGKLGVDEATLAAYYALNRNKRSIGINLKSKKGVEVFYRLADKVDVVFEGFRPGVVQRLGVDYETLKKRNPGIIYCSLSGYGQDGPYKLLPGHDINYVSIGGALGLFGRKGGPPALPMNIVGDFAGGSLHAVVGILLALMAREKTGEGQYVDISMTDGVVNLMADAVAQYLVSGKAPVRGEVEPYHAPYYDTYEAKDGKYISLGAVEPWFWERLCHALGGDDLIPLQYDLKARPRIVAYFTRVLRTKNSDEWFKLLWEQDVPVSKVYSLEEAIRDPQLLHRQMIIEVPSAKLGKVRHPGIAVKLSGTPGKVRFTGPLFNENAEQILLEAGYTATEIKELQKEGAVGRVLPQPK